MAFAGDAGEHAAVGFAGFGDGAATDGEVVVLQFQAEFVDWGRPRSRGRACGKS